MTSAYGVPADDLYKELGPEFIVLSVDKKQLKAELKTWPEKIGEGKVLSSFTVAIGKEQGDKTKRGDNKTPEGIYFTQKIIDGETLPAKYGPFAIPLNYPNPMDRLASKTGSGIWLHGVIKDERVEEANVTEGCVAFYNSDIIQLTKWLLPNQGVVMISEDGAAANNEVDVKAVRDATLSWAKSWAERRIDGYIAAYDEDFRAKGMDLAGYKDYKQRVFNSYKNMKVAIHKLRVLTHPKYAVSFLEQDFNGDDRFVSYGRKILYWRKADDGVWRITREIYEDRRIEFVQFSLADHGESPGSQVSISNPDKEIQQSL